MKKLAESLMTISLVLLAGCSTASSIGRIGFVGSHGINQPEYLVTASGNGAHTMELLNLGYPDEQTAIVAWSRDRRLAYCSNDGTLGIVDANGKNRHTIANLDQYGVSSISWSSDSKKILLSGSGMTIVDTTTGDITKLNINTSGNQDNFLTSDLAVFSTDGRKIAFRREMYSVNPLKRTSIGVYVMDADGGNVKEMTTIDTPGPPVWSPNGRKILYGNGIDLFTVDVTTGISLNLTNNPSAVYIKSENTLRSLPQG